jgi:antitoxin component of RelBE/YafQ-DinJ toxin-antitoxin module
MANLSNPNISIRATEEDKKLLAKLRKKLGVEVSQIVRLGLRALAAKEGVTV